MQARIPNQARTSLLLQRVPHRHAKFLPREEEPKTYLAEDCRAYNDILHPGILESIEVYSVDGFVVGDKLTVGTPANREAGKPGHPERRDKPA